VKYSSDSAKTICEGVERPWIQRNPSEGKGYSCKIDAAHSFEGAKEFLETNEYDIAVLDIMGVRGYDLLEIAKQKGTPAYASQYPGKVV
jgi:hypothetical protein